MDQEQNHYIQATASKNVLLIHKKVCASTNDYIKQNYKELRSNFPLFVVADRQQKGRGREGRDWYSAEKLGLYASFGIHFPDLRSIHLLPLAAGIAVTDALRDEISLPYRLKWPNDIMVNDKKIAGILVENIIHGEESVCICGIGININHTLDDFPMEIRTLATSLKIIEDDDFDIPTIADRLTHTFFYWMDKLENGDKEAIIAHWHRLSRIKKGEKIRFCFQGEDINGQFAGLDQSGGLCLVLPSGEKRTFYTGELAPSS